MSNLFNPYLPNPADEELSLRLLRESSERRRRSSQRRRHAMAAMMEQDDYLELERLRDETEILKERLFMAQEKYAYELLRSRAFRKSIEHLLSTTDEEQVIAFFRPFKDAAWNDSALWHQVCDKMEHETRPLPLAEVRQRRQARQAARKK